MVPVIRVTIVLKDLQWNEYYLLLGDQLRLLLFIIFNFRRKHNCVKKKLLVPFSKESFSLFISPNPPETLNNPSTVRSLKMTVLVLIT